MTQKRKKKIKAKKNVIEGNIEEESVPPLEEPAHIEEAAVAEIEHKMSVIIRSEPPAFISTKTNKAIPYEEYRLELEAWTISSDVDKKKLAVIAARSLPEQVDGVRLRSRVMKEITLAELNTDHGMEKLFEWLDKKFLKDENAEGFKYFKEWMNLERDELKHKTMEEFIECYDFAVCNAESKGVNNFDVIKSFRLLEACKLSSVEKQLVFSGIDFKKKKDLYEETRRALVKFKGESAQMIGSDTKENILDAAFLSQHEDVLASYGYKKQFQSKFKNNGVASKTNPKGPNGKPRTCHHCGSEFHFIYDCDKKKKESKDGKPDGEHFSWIAEMEEPGRIEEAHTADITLPQIYEETDGKGVLDCACSSPVAGENWVFSFIKSLSIEDQRDVKEEKSNKSFRFGGGEIRNSIKAITLPVIIAGVKGTIKTDVIKADLPLLIGMPVLEKAKIKIDFGTHEAIIFGKKILLEKLPIGHYVLPLSPAYQKKVDICLMTRIIDSADEKERYNGLKHLHEQMGHPQKENLERLIKNADKWRACMNEQLKTIYDKCETCKLFAKTPARSVVAMPRASAFNDILTLDIKMRDGKLILYMIDHFSRLTKGIFVKSKKPPEIVKAIMLHWVAAGFGLPGSLHSDVGGEFTNAEVIEMAEQLGCKVTSTAGSSPYMNGLNERNHHTVDRMYSMIEEDNPGLTPSEILSHALHAKNSLQMVHGFSSYQLVFGKAPNIPGLTNVSPPMLNDVVEGDVMRKHLNALYSSRQAYVKSESDSKLKLALKSNLRRCSKDLKCGEWIYYKREDERWKGPAKIVGVDGKKLFVTQGGLLSRVAAGMAVRVGEEFVPDNSLSNKSNEPEEESTIHPQTNVIHEDIHNPDGDKEKNDDIETLAPTINEENVSVENVDNINDEREVADDHDNNVNNVNVENDEKNEVKAANDKIMFQKNDKVAFKEVGKHWQEATVLSRGGKVTGKFPDYYNVQLEDKSRTVRCINFGDVEDWKKVEEFNQVEQVNVVMVPKLMHREKEVVEAKMKQLDDWKKFNVYEEVEDVGQDRISGTWVVVKKEVDGKEGTKAKWVARGFQEDIELRVDSPTVSKLGIRLLFAIAFAKEWAHEVIDVKSAFLQGDSLDRELYMDPPSEEKKENVIWKLLKPVYGLNDASLKWYERLDKELLNLNCSRSKYDNACYIFKENGKLAGVVCVFVDDVIGAGNASFKSKVMDGLKEKFSIGKIEEGLFRYVGTNIEQKSNEVLIDQEHYIDSIKMIEMADFKHLDNEDLVDKDGQAIFRSKVGALNWLAIQTRPDIVYNVMESSTSFGKATVKNLKEVNKCIRAVKNDHVKILIPQLKDISSWKIVSFADGAHANLPDKISSSGGHLIFIVDKFGNSCPLSWATNKIQRVGCRSHDSARCC